MIILLGLLVGVGLLFGVDHMYPYTPKYHFLILGLHQISYIEYWIYNEYTMYKMGIYKMGWLAAKKYDIDTKWYYTESTIYKMGWLTQKFKISKSSKPSIPFRNSHPKELYVFMLKLLYHNTSKNQCSYPNLATLKKLGYLCLTCYPLSCSMILWLSQIQYWEFQHLVLRHLNVI